MTVNPAEGGYDPMLILSIDYIMRSLCREEIISEEERISQPFNTVVNYVFPDWLRIHKNPSKRSSLRLYSWPSKGSLYSGETTLR